MKLYFRTRENNSTNFKNEPQRELFVFFVPLCGLFISPLAQTLFQIPVQGVYRDTILEHRVAVANGDLIIFERLMIDGHAKRSADLVLPCVALSDIAAVVEKGAHSP